MKTTGIVFLICIVSPAFASTPADPTSCSEIKIPTKQTGKNMYDDRPYKLFLTKRDEIMQVVQANQLSLLKFVCKTGCLNDDDAKAQEQLTRNKKACEDFESGLEDVTFSCKSIKLPNRDDVKNANPKVPLDYYSVFENRIMTVEGTINLAIADLSEALHPGKVLTANEAKFRTKLRSYLEECKSLRSELDSMRDAAIFQ